MYKLNNNSVYLSEHVISKFKRPGIDYVVSYDSSAKQIRKV